MHDRGVKCGQEPRRRADEGRRERERERGREEERKREDHVTRESRAAEKESSTKMGGSYFGWE